jgi:hypothetical protein
LLIGRIRGAGGVEVTPGGAVPLGGTAGGIDEIRVPYPSLQIRLSEILGLNPEMWRSKMAYRALKLTNDDDPASLAPRTVEVVRDGLIVGAQPAVVARVSPPLYFGGDVGTIVLSSRTFGVPVDEILARAHEQPGRVFVCRYIGRESPIPADLDKDDLEILFWGRVEALPQEDVAESDL